MNLKHAAITFKLARGSEEGEDFQDVFVDGEQVGKLAWWTGATAGWYFEDMDEQPHYVCPLEREDGAVTKYGDPILIPLDEVKERAATWLRNRGKV